MLSFEFLMYDQLFSKIYLLLSIQYPLNNRKSGENLIKLRAFLLKVSSIAGGYLTDHATTTLSHNHWLKRVNAAIGNKIGIPRPYIIVI